MSGQGGQSNPPASSTGTSGCLVTSSSGGGSKADAIWQQLKSAHAAPKAQNINFNKLWHGFSSDPAHGANKAAKTQPQQQTYDSQLVGRRQPAQTEAAPKLPPGQGQPAPAAKPDAEAAQQLVTRCVAGLKDSSQAARRRALQDVQTQILDNPALGEQWLAERLEGDGLGKALLRRFDDPADSCREMAVTSLLRLLQAAPQAVLSLLPYTFPVLAERVRHKEEGSKNLTEPCEEVRLALARLLRSLVVLGGKSFGGYAGEAVELVAALCEDPFHEVQEEACGVVGAMNDVLGLRLQPVAKQLVAAVLPLTTAKRHRVRIAALQALRPTMHQGAHEMILEMVAWRDPNVIPIKAFYGDDLKVNFCGKLAADPHPAVRREFLAVVGDWMTSLRERVDHESRLLPFVLSALNDEAPEIQADAVALLERLGLQYEKDHEKDLRDTLSYLPEEAHGIGWQAPGAAGYVYGTVAAGEETVNGGRAVFVLPGPLRSRPRLGTRRLVQSNFGRIVGALSEEVTSWLLEARRRAAALLRTQLVLAEEWSEQHLHLLMPALCKAISDPEVRAPIRDCCAVVGAFTDPELALQLLQPRVADEAADLAMRAATLEVLACVTRGAGPRRALDAHLPAVLDMIGTESLLSSEDARIRRALYEVVDQLLATCGPACGRHAARLLWICLHLRSPGRTAQALPTTAAAAAAAAAGLAAPAEAPGSAAAGGLLLGSGPVAADPSTGAVVEAVLLPRLAEVCGYGGGVDEVVESHRRELLEQIQPGSSLNVLLAAGVQCRLMLPHAAQSALLHLPDETLARVLQPVAPEGTPAGAASASSAMEVDAAETAEARAGGAGGSGAQHPSSSARGPLSSLWQAGSTVAVLTHLASDLASWLPLQPRCATLAMVCLEACLAYLPFPPAAARSEAVGSAEVTVMTETAAAEGDDAEAAAAAVVRRGDLLLDVLVQALSACSQQEGSPAALLAALRCVHTALRRQLAPGEALVRHLDRLVGCLAACMAVVSAAACRLQACYVLQMLVATPAVAAALAEGVQGGGRDAAATSPAVTALQSVCTAVSARLYDAADEVRCAALGLVKEVVVNVGGVETVGKEGCVGRLVAEIVQLRDVSPGSAFFDEYQAFRAWTREHGWDE